MGSNGIIYRSGHTNIDGWTFVFSAASTREIKHTNKLTIEEAVRLCDIAVDNRGRCRKNRFGARGAEPVENPSPMIGELDPLKPNPTLEDRLQLRHAMAYRFGGIVEGEGFYVTVAVDVGCEGWGVVRHHEDVYYKNPDHSALASRLLVTRDSDDERFWATFEQALIDCTVISGLDIEDEKEAIRLALDITDGRCTYPEWVS